MRQSKTQAIAKGSTSRPLPRSLREALLPKLSSALPNLISSAGPRRGRGVSPSQDTEVLTVSKARRRSKSIRKPTGRPAAGRREDQSATPIRPERLRPFIASIFHALGVPDADADTVAEIIVEADLRGVESHGSTRVAGYASMIKLGLLNPRPKIEVLREAPSTAMLEGDNAFGMVVAWRAMTMALDKAASAGIACVTARNVTHTGMVGFYPMMAARRGFIGLSCNNGPTILPPFGGTTPTLATNPFSAASPRAEKIPSCSTWPRVWSPGASCAWRRRRACPYRARGRSTAGACRPPIHARPSSMAFSNGRAATRASAWQRWWRD